MNTTISSITIPQGTVLDHDNGKVVYADGSTDFLYPLNNGQELPLGLLTEAASQSAEAFFDFISSIELSTTHTWLIGWLQQSGFNDAMANVFFYKFYNGDMNGVTLYDGGAEFPSIIDDLQAAMTSMRQCC